MTPTDRFFYHAFPQGLKGEAGIDRGLLILASILDRGLVLTPEPLEHERSTYVTMAKRVCFTELAPQDLVAHSQKFGSFALEWDYQTLLQMGALPVFYLPLLPDAWASACAESIYSALGAVSQMLERLRDINDAGTKMLPGQTLNIALNGTMTPTAIGKAQIEQLKRILEFEGMSVEAALNAFRAFGSLLQRTADPRSDDMLSFFREREWRVVGNMLRDQRPVTEALSAADAEALLSVSPEFFGQTMRFRTGEYRLVDQCQVYRHVGDIPFRNTVRRIIVPAAAMDSARLLLSARSLERSVVSFEEATR